MANRCVHRQIPMAIKSPMPLRLVMEVSSPYPPSSKLHESCPAGLYTGWLQTAVGIDTGCPPGQTIYSEATAPKYFSFENSVQSVWYLLFSSSQQKSETFENTCSARSNKSLFRWAIYFRFTNGRGSGGSVEQSTTCLLRTYVMISAFLNPLISFFGPSRMTGLSEPMKLPLGLIATRQDRPVRVSRMCSAALKVC